MRIVRCEICHEIAHGATGGGVPRIIAASGDAVGGFGRPKRAAALFRQDAVGGFVPPKPHRLGSFCQKLAPDLIASPFTRVCDALSATAVDTRLV
jgi:hypothetical protein